MSFILVKISLIRYLINDSSLVLQLDSTIVSLLWSFELNYIASTTAWTYIIYLIIVLLFEIVLIRLHIIFHAHSNKQISRDFNHNKNLPIRLLTWNWSAQRREFPFSFLPAHLCMFDSFGRMKPSDP